MSARDAAKLQKLLNDLETHLTLTNELARQTRSSAVELPWFRPSKESVNYDAELLCETIANLQLLEIALRRGWINA